MSQTNPNAESASESFEEQLATLTTLHLQDKISLGIPSKEDRLDSLIHAMNQVVMLKTVVAAKKEILPSSTLNKTLQRLEEITERIKTASLE